MDRVFTCLGPGAPNPICMCIDQPEQSKHNTDDKSEGAAGYVPVRPGFVNIQIQCPTNYTICRDEKLEPSISPGAKDGKIECKCDVPLMHRKIATLDVLGPSPSATFEGLASCTRIGETNTCWYTITADLDGDKKLSEKEWEATFGENCEWSGADVELKTFTVPPFLDSKHKEGDELKNPMPRINYVWVNHPLCPPSTPNTQAKCTNTERIVSYRTCAASKRELTNFPFSCYAMKECTDILPGEARLKWIGQHWACKGSLGLSRDFDDCSRFDLGSALERDSASTTKVPDVKCPFKLPGNCYHSSDSISVEEYGNYLADDIKYAQKTRVENKPGWYLLNGTKWPRPAYVSMEEKAAKDNGLGASVYTGSIPVVSDIIWDDPNLVSLFEKEENPKLPDYTLSTQIRASKDGPTYCQKDFRCSRTIYKSSARPRLKALLGSFWTAMNSMDLTGSLTCVKNACLRPRPTDITTVAGLEGVLFKIRATVGCQLSKVLTCRPVRVNKPPGNPMMSAFTIAEVQASNSAPLKCDRKSMTVPFVANFSVYRYSDFGGKLEPMDTYNDDTLYPRPPGVDKGDARPLKSAHDDKHDLALFGYTLVDGPYGGEMPTTTAYRNLKHFKDGTSGVTFDVSDTTVSNLISDYCTQFSAQW